MTLIKAAKLYDLVEYGTQYSRSNWIRQNQPDIWEKTHKFLCLSGYLTHRMTGEFRDSAGNIIGTMPFDVKTFGWASKDDLKWKLFSVEEEKLPDLVNPGELLGHVTGKAAEETGIPKGLPLIAASNDKACESNRRGLSHPGYRLHQLRHHRNHQHPEQRVRRTPPLTGALSVGNSRAVLLGSRR